MEPSEPKRQSILIVEDDADVSDALSLVLQDASYTVHCAGNGREALDHLRGGGRTDPPAVILLDLMMPVMNGHEFRAAQLADADLAGIPVLVLSGDGNVAQKAVAVHADGYLVKPVDVGTLLETVARHCRSDKGT